MTVEPEAIPDTIVAVGQLLATVALRTPTGCAGRMAIGGTGSR